MTYTSAEIEAAMELLLQQGVNYVSNAYMDILRERVVNAKHAVLTQDPSIADGYNHLYLKIATDLVQSSDSRLMQLLKKESTENPKYAADMKNLEASKENLARANSTLERATREVDLFSYVLSLATLENIKPLLTTAAPEPSVQKKKRVYRAFTDVESAVADATFADEVKGLILLSILSCGKDRFETHDLTRNTDTERKLPAVTDEAVYRLCYNLYQCTIPGTNDRVLTRPDKTSARTFRISNAVARSLLQDVSSKYNAPSSGAELTDVGNEAA